jgi:hypothetical protein
MLTVVYKLSLVVVVHTKIFAYAVSYPLMIVDLTFSKQILIFMSIIYLS